MKRDTSEGIDIHGKTVTSSDMAKKVITAAAKARERDTLLRALQRERDELAGGKMLAQRANAREGDMDMSRHNIVDCRRNAAIGHMGHFNAGSLLEQFASNVQHGAATGAGVGEAGF